MASNKSQEAQSGSYRPGGPGLKVRMTKRHPTSANIPSKTIKTSPNSHQRGKDGK